MGYRKGPPPAGVCLEMVVVKQRLLAEASPRLPSPVQEAWLFSSSPCCHLALCVCPQTQA